MIVPLIGSLSVNVTVNRGAMTTDEIRDQARAAGISFALGIRDSIGRRRLEARALGVLDDSRPLFDELSVNLVLGEQP